MIWSWLVALLLGMGIIYLSQLCYYIAFHSITEKAEDLYDIPPGKQYEAVADRLRQMIDSARELPFELVMITADDGEHLAARYYHFHDNAPVQILLHGYRSNSLREFSGSYPLAKQLGYNVIVVDERGHGYSGGSTISFGIRERYDCLQWSKYAAKRFGEDTPIFLTGVSMGAATVLMASELKLPGNVKCIVADCPYSSPKAIIQKVSLDVKLPPALSYPFVMLGALLFGKFKLWESSPVKAVRNATIPILLLHGEDDRFVPCSMSREIFQACRVSAQLETFPNAGHGLSYLTDSSRYQKILEDFLDRCGVLCKRNP